jgi:hypothetical protein
LGLPPDLSLNLFLFLNQPLIPLCSLHLLSLQFPCKRGISVIGILFFFFFIAVLILEILHFLSLLLSPCLSSRVTDPIIFVIECRPLSLSIPPLSLLLLFIKLLHDSLRDLTVQNVFDD